MKGACRRFKKEKDRDGHGAGKEERMSEKMNLRKFAWIAGGILAVFLVLFLLLHNQVQQTREKETGLRVTLGRLEEENNEMNLQISQVGTEDYIVSSAMTNFAFMNKNDLRFEFTNPEALYAYTEDELKILMDETAD